MVGYKQKAIDQIAGNINVALKFIKNFGRNVNLAKFLLTL